MKKNTSNDFWTKVKKSDGCWIWTGKINQTGYGEFYFAGKTVLAHRFAYKDVFGCIPVGQQVDHTCHNKDLKCKGGKACLHRRCVRPDHLEAATGKQNISRAKSKIMCCPQGHVYNQANTILYQGRRYCRTCIGERTAAREKLSKRWLKRVDYLREWRKKKRRARLL